MKARPSALTRFREMTRIKDGDWHLVDYNPWSKQSRWRRDNPDGTITYRMDQPVDELVRVNAEIRKDTAGQRWGEGKRIASIPTNVWWRGGLARAAEQGDDKFLSKWLNDPENRAFRTFEGQV